MATSLSNNLSGAPPSSRAVLVLHGLCRCRPLEGLARSTGAAQTCPQLGDRCTASENSSTKALSLTAATPSGNTTTVFSTQHRIIAAGGTAPTAAPARARPRPCAHPLPVCCALYAKRASRQPAFNGHRSSRAFVAGAPLTIPQSRSICGQSIVFTDNASTGCTTNATRATSRIDERSTLALSSWTDLVLLDVWARSSPPSHQSYLRHPTNYG